MSDTDFPKNPKEITNSIIGCTALMILGAAGLSIIISLTVNHSTFQGKSIVTWFFGIQSAIMFVGGWYTRNLYRNALEKINAGVDPNIDDEEGF